MTDGTANKGLGELFKSHYDGVLAYCARRIGRDEAEDAASEVFAIVSRRADEIDWTTVRPWLYGIARGVLANRWRSLHRRQRVFGLIAGMAPNSEDRPEEVIIRRAEDREAITALQRMRPTDREVLMLSAWEELTGPQIATALGISVAAAEQRLHRAKQRFARTLRPVTTLTSYGFNFKNEGGK
jgi:RNA polymerase sigma factor (sigma-70 family)